MEFLLLDRLCEPVSGGESHPSIALGYTNGTYGEFRAGPLFFAVRYIERV
jgi:hypothetical protein